NEFDYFIGGPIVRNRTFFFTSYDGVRQSGSRASLVTVETPEFRDFVLRTRPNTIAAKLLRDVRPAVDPTTNFRDLGSPAPRLNEFRGSMARVVGLSDIPPHLEIPLININAASGFSTASFPSGYYQTNFDYKDTFSWIHNAHTLKMGGELRRVRADSHNTTN